MVDKVMVGVRWLLALMFILAGVLHFLKPEPFVRIVPPILPLPVDLVYVSGLFEVILGIVFLTPSGRRTAMWGLILLLIAVFPANVYAAITSTSLHPAMPGISPVIAWLRLPFQPMLIAAVYWSGRSEKLTAADDTVRIRASLPSAGRIQQP